MQCAILSSVACPALTYSSTLSSKLHDLKNLLNIKCFDFLYKFWLKHLPFYEDERDRKKCVLVFMQTNRHFCPIFNETWTFSTNIPTPNFMKIRPVCSTRTNNERDRTKLLSRFSQIRERAPFCKKPGPYPVVQNKFTDVPKELLPQSTAQSRERSIFYRYRKTVLFTKATLRYAEKT